MSSDLEDSGCSRRNMAKGLNSDSIESCNESSDMEHDSLIDTKYYNTSSGDRRNEKHWQRVPNVYLILVLGYYLLLVYVVQCIEDELPTPIPRDLRPNDSNIFSEDLAWDGLYDIIGEGPRVAGTKYHLSQTNILMKILEVIAEGANTPVHVDWQFASGDYSVSPSSPVNSYQNLSNIVAVLQGKSGFHGNYSTKSSVLFNCHYDSVPGAPGASDNALFCGALIEILSRLSKRKNRLKHNIVFLFNGAEENFLQGSHAFLKHHWAEGVKAVVNLDSAGMNGKPSLFQVTHPRLLATYKKSTNRPSAQSIGEIIFKYIPSDTDFKIWRDFGHIYGIDLAFTKWGQVYHTRYDDHRHIKPGVLQLAGDQLLVMAKYLASDPNLEVQISPSSPVYFDYLNTVLFVYSHTTARIFDGVVVLLAISSVLYYVWIVGFRWSSLRELAASTLFLFFGIIFGIIAVSLVTIVTSVAKLQLRYLSNPWIVIPTIWLPFVIATISFSHHTDVQIGLTRSLRCQRAMASSRLLLALILSLGLVFPITSASYVLSVPLMLTAIAAFISLTIHKYCTKKAWQLLIVVIVLSTPSMMFMFELCLRLDALLLPIMGRSPINDPDQRVAVVNTALAILTTAHLSGVELLFCSSGLLVPLAPLAAACLLASLTPLSPYDDDRLVVQRHLWFHTSIINYDNNNEISWYRSGVFVSKQDAHTTDTVIRTMNGHHYPYKVYTNLTEECDKYVYCNMPVIRQSMNNSIKEGIFVEIRPPRLFKPHPSLTVNATQWEGETCHMQFYMIGSTHNLLTLWPRANVTLVSWSFSSPVHHTFTFKERPVFVVTHAVATYSELIAPLQFNLTFHVPTALRDKPTVDVSHHAHKTAHPEAWNEEYRWFVAAVPDYFDVTSVVTWRLNYVF